MLLNHHRAGTGEALLLIHGIGSRWQVWEPVLERLTAEREVVAIDLPGFAASPPAPPGTSPGIRSLTQLVTEFLDASGLERPHVAGNSLGGWISLELAKQGAVRSATALSPAGFHTQAESVYQRTSLWVAVRTARLLASRADRALATPRGRRMLFSQMVARPEQIPAPDAADSLRALAYGQWFDATLTAIGRSRFAGGEEIEVPVTIGWGEHDRLLLPRQAPRAAREVPRARMVTLWGCGHVPTYDDPEQVARVILEGSCA